MQRPLLEVNAPSPSSTWGNSAKQSVRANVIRYKTLIISPFGRWRAWRPLIDEGPSAVVHPDYMRKSGLGESLGHCSRTFVMSSVKSFALYGLKAAEILFSFSCRLKGEDGTELEHEGRGKRDVPVLGPPMHYARFLSALRRDLQRCTLVRSDMIQWVSIATSDRFWSATSTSRWNIYDEIAVSSTTAELGDFYETFASGRSPGLTLFATACCIVLRYLRWKIDRPYRPIWILN